MFSSRLRHTMLVAGLIALCGLCLPGLSQAQKRSKARAEKETGPKPITRFGFTQLTGGVIVIRATLDNYRDSLNFILDTGSGGISLDSATVVQLGVPTQMSDRTIRGIAGVRQVEFAYNHRLNLPRLQVDSLDFHINDYSLLTGVYGLKVDGIIGYSFFRRYIVTVDFDTMQIAVYEPQDFPYPRGGYTLRPAIAGLPMQYATLSDGGDTYLGRFYIDTGAGLCLLLSEQYLADSSVFRPGKKTFGTVAEGIGGKKEMHIAVMKHFKLGRYKFKHMPVYIFDDEFNVTSYPYLGGLIGNDLLRRFNMVINYRRSEIHLNPNKHFRDPFDYAYTGLALFQLGDGIYVTDVLPGSPAAKAGLRDGDQVVGIENKFGASMQDYKNVLQTAGRKIKMIVRRDAQLEEITLAVENIRRKSRKA